MSPTICERTKWNQKEFSQKVPKMFYRDKQVESSVAKTIATVADRAGYPGRIQEYKKLCLELNLPDTKKVTIQTELTRC